ncbi:MAG: helix-turn-helix transcriptional regulator [Nitrospiraceae bacterium]|nr:helix-turn-helix transcriptional regulator [Nitrospiraceae bacterium]
MTKELLRKLKRDHRHKKLGGIARAMGIPYSTLYRIVEGQSKGSVDTWEKIEAFYEAHEKICLKAGCAGRMADETMGGD